MECELPFKTVANFTTRSDCVMLRETAKKGKKKID